MLNRHLKSTIAFFLFCNLLLVTVFAVDFVFYRDVAVFPLNSFFHKTTELDWQMTDSQFGENFDRIKIINLAVGCTVSLVNLFGINALLYGRFYGHVILPIPLFWKIAVPLIGLLLYAPFFYNVKYRADYYHLYMALAPAGWLSFFLLALGAVGIKTLKKQRRASDLLERPEQ